MNANSRPLISPIESSPRDRLMSIQEVMAIVGLRRTTIYEMIRTGQFPKQVKPSKHASRWIEREVLEWLRRCSDERNIR